MAEFDDDLNQGQTQNGEPAGQETPPAQGGEPEFFEVKVRDESWKAPRDLTQQFADALGWPMEKLQERLQIGYDGSRVYENLNQKRDELEEYQRELEEIRDGLRQRGVQPEAERGYQPAQPTVRQPAGPRPPAHDVTGTVLWLADQIERMSPLLERVPEIERGLSRTHETIEERERTRDFIEERSFAMQAYDGMVEDWKKQGFGDPPPRKDLEAYLRRFPMSDNVDMSWQEIWDAAAWAVGGSQVARRQRRQAVLDSQHPEARIITTAPASRSAGPVNPNAPKPLTGQESMAELEGNIKQLESELSGMTLGQLRSGGQ